jgi:hypothetical protein
MLACNNSAPALMSFCSFAMIAGFFEWCCTQITSGGNYSLSHSHGARAALRHGAAHLRRFGVALEVVEHLAHDGVGQDHLDLRVRQPALLPLLQLLLRQLRVGKAAACV